MSNATGKRDALDSIAPPVARQSTEWASEVKPISTRRRKAIGRTTAGLETGRVRTERPSQSQGTSLVGTQNLKPNKDTLRSGRSPHLLSRVRIPLYKRSTPYRPDRQPRNGRLGSSKYRLSEVSAVGASLWWASGCGRHGLRSLELGVLQVGL
jgi:hypothetical protein